MRDTFLVHSTCRAVLFLLLIEIMLPSLIIAQIAHNERQVELKSRSRIPAKNAHIIDYPIETEGPLYIRYSDGTDVEIPKERGRFGDLTQEAFSDIQLADDRQHIGWLADYRICAQSYPCHAELVIYESGHKLKYIPPSHGIIWSWQFLEGGKKILVRSGFPHGDDTGASTLYDIETGREIGKSSSKEK